MLFVVDVTQKYAKEEKKKKHHSRKELSQYNFQNERLYFKYKI